MDTKQIFGSSYHPNTQGLVERFNGTLAIMLAKFTNEQQDDWDLHLKFVVFAYNTAEHDSLATSPFKMLFGREPVYPLETAFMPSENTDEEQGDYVAKLKKKKNAFADFANLYQESSTTVTKGGRHEATAIDTGGVSAQNERPAQSLISLSYRSHRKS